MKSSGQTMRQAKLRKYCLEVLRFRKALNLTSIKEEDEFMERFIMPSVALSEWMPRQGRLLDIGSGMGVPGIPLLIVNPGLKGVLVERRKKRAEFLRHLVRMLELDAEVFDADVNDLSDLRVDICVARAVTNIESLLRMCTPHVNEGAIAVLPVPQFSEPVHVAGWCFKAKHSIQAGDMQQVHCYSYKTAHSCAKGEVPRET